MFRGHLRTQAVCATQNVEQAGEMETKKEWERNVFHCLHEMQRGAADTQRVCRYLT